MHRRAAYAVVAVRREAVAFPIRQRGCSAPHMLDGNGFLTSVCCRKRVLNICILVGSHIGKSRATSCSLCQSVLNQLSQLPSLMQTSLSFYAGFTRKLRVDRTKRLKIFGCCCVADCLAARLEYHSKADTEPSNNKLYRAKKTKVALSEPMHSLIYNDHQTLSSGSEAGGG